MRKRFYLLVLSVLAFAGVHAQYVAPSEGVFRIINAQYDAALSETFLGATLKCEAAGTDTDYDQLWILKKSGSNYTLRNAYSGRYIQTGNKEHEVAYWTESQEAAFNIAPSSKGGNMYNIWDPTFTDEVLGTVGLHAKGPADKVVRWRAEANKKATEWYFVKVSVTEEDLKDVCFGANEETYGTALAKYFEDAACTKLKSAYASVDEVALRDAMTADRIPATLIDMAIKVKDGDWTEANENGKPQWDSDYAKKFRVQLVEPHSIAGEITSWFGYNAHTSMDNPTGVYVNNGEVLYIMVEGEIKEGAELWASFIEGHSKMPNYAGGRFSNGHRLHSGLNMIPCFTNGSAIYINYLVHTYDANTKTFPHKLSEYDDLKVHFAGGHINGYYNAHGDALYKADTDADWVYYEERANLRNITILGKHQVLQFELNDVTHTEEDGKTWTERGLAKLFPEELPASLPDNQRINAIVEAWDRIMLSELMTLGVVSKEVVDSMNALYPRWDAAWKEKAEMYNYEGYAEFCQGRDYGEYYNHRGLAFGTVTGYMYGGWDHCGYHINTTSSILTKIATEAGATWGPGHEIGHQHQGLFTVNGLTEVTNNLFSNIAVWYMGMGTSRQNSTEGNLSHVYDNFKSGGDFFGNNIWALTHMYYRLWLYYHRAGNDTQFYPKLFELLRRNPISKGYEQQGKTSILHFYQMCCDAAQEDLTEFFRAHGFFRVMNSRLVGDYSNSVYTQTQEDIDEAIAAIKAKGYPVNDKPLFINDCTPDPTYSHDGKTQRSYWDPNHTPKGVNAEVGIYVDFMSDDSIQGTYLYTENNLNITVSGGEGALGFAVYNTKGEILAFSSHHKFSINEEVLNMLRSKEAKVVAITAVENQVEILSEAVGGTENQQISALRAMLAEAKAYMEQTDNTGTKAGMLIPDSITELNVLVEKIEKVLDTKDTSEATFGEWNTRLDSTLVSLLNNYSARVPVYSRCYYSVAFSENAIYTMGYASAGLRTSATGAGDYENQWLIVPASAEGTYYMQNRSTGYYITSVSENVRVKAASSNVQDAVAFRFVIGEPGEFMIQCVGNENVYVYNDASKRQVNGGDASKSTWWNLILVDDMLGLPDEGTDGKCVVYHIQLAENSSCLYKNTSRRYEGRVSVGEYESAEDMNYWFYFKEGGTEGTYRIYNYATTLPVSLSDGYYYVNKDVAVPTEYVIKAAADRSGLTFSAVEGNWYVSGSYLGAKEDMSSLFKLVKIGEAVDTSIEKVAVEEDSSTCIYYDLLGRPVEKPTRGIYIYNGKKVVFDR